MDSPITTLYGKRVRVRVCGLCWRGDALLMVNHSGLHAGNFWAPPGGGIEFGQTAEETIIREFEEETGIQVSLGRFLFVCEFIQEPFHAIELFFEVLYPEGELITGIDPEMKNAKQIIDDVRWMPWSAIKTVPEENLHGVFRLCQKPEDLMHLNAYCRI